LTLPSHNPRGLGSTGAGALAYTDLGSVPTRPDGGLQGFTLTRSSFAHGRFYSSRAADALLGFCLPRVFPPRSDGPAFTGPPLMRFTELPSRGDKSPRWMVWLRFRVSLVCGSGLLSLESARPFRGSSPPAITTIRDSADPGLSFPLGLASLLPAWPLPLWTC